MLGKRKVICISKYSADFLNGVKKYLFVFKNENENEISNC